MDTYRHRRVAVWGAARSGIAAANLLDILGAKVVLSDRAPLEELDLDGLRPGVDVEGGGNLLGDAEILVPSPGIRPSTPALCSALESGIHLMGEIELAASVAQGPIIAVTGTDGKSTTTMMTAAVVSAGGRKAIVAGNIGVPFSERVLEAGPKDILVIEVSAFQLWSCQTFCPTVAIVTNVAEDHLEYFDGDMKAYTRAKARLLKDMRPGATAVLRGDDPVVSAMHVPPEVDRVLFGPSVKGTGWGLSNGQICRNGRPIFSVDQIPVPGTHNQYNALAAFAAGAAFGLAGPAMTEGIKSFRGLPHRFQFVRERNGVRWFDDSKATNPHAAAAGLNGVKPPMILISGGYDKGLDLAPFIESARGAKHIILTGPTAERTARELGDGTPHSFATDMHDAVRRADRLADAGDWVILSPAASSFDAYRSFVHRGEVFQGCVQAL